MMNQKCKIFIEKLSILQEAPNKDDLIEVLYELTEDLEGVEGADAVIPHIFSFMEACSSIDLGSPGPLVHFVEKYYPHYDHFLLSSIQRQPVSLTLWMCNRILNANIEEQRIHNIISALKHVCSNNEISHHLRMEAESYLKRQLER